MSYELLILPKKWLFTNDGPEKFNVLANVINKAYSKPMHKYGIINSPRIKQPAKFLDDLQVTEGKECFITILLGTDAVFSKIEAETGFKRKFHYDLYPLSTSINSDIPKEYKPYFGPLLPDSNVKIIVADASTTIDKALADRIVAVCGYKSYSEEEKTIERAGVKEYELTTFVSFMSGSGPELLNYTLANFLCTLESEFIDLKNAQKCIVYAVVIREHDLVRYYTTKCQFDLFGKPDMCVPMSGEGSPLEWGIVSTRDFHLSFLQREVPFKKS